MWRDPTPSVQCFPIEPEADHGDDQREEGDRPELWQNLGKVVALEEHAAHDPRLIARLRRDREPENEIAGDEEEEREHR